jgi:hypothetical protein
VPARPRGLRGPVLLAVALLVLAGLLHVRDPHRSGSWGVCPWLLLTGTWCPGCGGLRAVHDLTDGDLRAAASSNLLLVASLPLVALAWARTVVGRCRGPVRTRRAVAADRQLVLALGYLGLAVGFAVLRNTGAGHWLAP